MASRVFVPASASSDSAYLLYKLLTETDYEIITRIYVVEAWTDELYRHRVVCDWLYKNTRPFDFRQAEYEIDTGYGLELEPLNTYKRVLATSARLANDKKCDMIGFGYNLHNWSMSNWFFADNDQSNESFYDEDSEYNNIDLNISRQTHFIIRQITDIPIYWPLMHDKSNRDSAFGRWQIWHNLPSELKPLVSISCRSVSYNNDGSLKSVCGRCMDCVGHKWYNSKTMTPKEIDDCIMKYGEYGKYWTKASNPSTRNRAYDMFVDGKL